ncbi:hypothetical protein AZE42_09142 [Rhizopogon vesiculosus]|uniref:Uncharacterized protein n=1 Tax=Rhizopogon vesiculosus TaxID=180088 RepID=A0A1J8PF07_9AGAM|nr:hypothetical protein AZE42_09142 [Rhizopogon vesiculosus]
MDAFGFSDWSLDSALGVSNSRAYEALIYPYTGHRRGHRFRPYSEHLYYYRFDAVLYHIPATGHLVEMPFPWHKLYNLPNVIPVHSSTKNNRTQRNSTHDEPGHSSFLPGISNHSACTPPTPVSTSPLVHDVSASREPAGREVSTVSSDLESFRRRTSDMVQLFLPIVQVAAGAIPLAGPPIQGAISGLLAIIQAIDVRSYFILMTYVDFKGYCREIVSSQMQMRNDVREVLAGVQRLECCVGQGATQLTRTIALGVVTLVDATGYEHHLLVDHCTSFEQLKIMVSGLLEHDSVEAQIQK